METIFKLIATAKVIATSSITFLTGLAVTVGTFGNSIADQFADGTAQTIIATTGRISAALLAVALVLRNTVKALPSERSVTVTERVQ